MTRYARLIFGVCHCGVTQSEKFSSESNSESSKHFQTYVEIYANILISGTWTYQRRMPKSLQWVPEAFHSPQLEQRSNFGAHPASYSEVSAVFFWGEATGAWRLSLSPPSPNVQNEWRCISIPPCLHSMYRAFAFNFITFSLPFTHRYLSLSTPYTADGTSTFRFLPGLYQCVLGNWGRAWGSVVVKALRY